MMTIVVMNPANDIHCQYMIAQLQKRGIPYAELGSPLQHDYALLNDQLLYDGKPLPPVQAVYFRGVLTHNPDPLANADAGKRLIDNMQFAARVEVVQSWLGIMAASGVAVLNQPGNRAKYVQLHTLQQAGLPLPETCITSSPEIARQFIRKVGKAVCKPIRGGSYCRKVDASMQERLDLIAAEPVILQEEIPGEDVRVNMLDGEVISAHVIHTAAGTLDYRTDPDYGSGMAEYELIALPEEVAAVCRKAANCLGLRFTGIDLRRNGNSYVLLECNSMPAYMDVELKTGAPITAALIDAMLAARPASLSATSHFRFESAAKPAIRRGETFFHYDDVVRKWQQQTARQQQRQLLAMNEEQIEQWHRQTGKRVSFMEVEMQEGQPRVVRLF
ncbi:ATP-grasp domain-containing protein [Xylanibacillus composti]|uniref:ATP-grasp domain-containing protein n=1 Tax=Xylanibacillus composti TaxID=1572762 RepID=A0A8J4M123_9BACL|nr:ATP-grasp domain-containing protein [Xylanibacillus composti]MDT9726210.1 ATP-grasp domain-containing protein [Xylanibacillus composti]GIQ68059.1 ATP-grasp domain-containing protein [Xylanibacillus composti]